MSSSRIADRRSFRTGGPAAPAGGCASPPRGATAQAAPAPAASAATATATATATAITTASTTNISRAAAAPRLDTADPPWRALVDAAAVPYRAGGRFAWHFARGKLGIDPVFRHLIGNGLIVPRSRVLDIGCGQGLLASLLRAADQQARHAGWPRTWGPAPLACRITGIELMRKDVERARGAWPAADVCDSEGPAAVFTCGDMRTTPFVQSDAVVILDVLHYIAVAEQDAVLARVRQALVPGGRLLLRVGDAAARRGFGLSQWVDRVVFRARGHRGTTPLHGRPLAQWIAYLEALGFAVQARPMSHGTPFANVLLVAQLPAEAGVDGVPAAVAKTERAA